MKKVYYEIHLPYFKQGDDLSHFLRQAKGKSKKIKHSKAFSDYAVMLDYCADVLFKLSKLAKEGKIEIHDAGTHHISVLVDEALGKELEKEGILYRDEEMFKEE